MTFLYTIYFIGCLMCGIQWWGDSATAGEFCARVFLWPLWLLRNMVRSFVKIWKEE